MNWTSARGYLWDRALRLLGRRPGRTLAAIAFIASWTAMAGLVLMVWQMLAPYADRVPIAEVSVFATSGTSAAELEELRGRVEAIEGVEKAIVLPRDEAWTELKKRVGPDKGGDLGANPLPDVVIAKFAPGAQPAIVEIAAASMRKLARVDAVQADLDWYRRLVLTTRGLVAGLASFAAVIVLAAVMLIVGLVRGVVAIGPTEVRVLEQIGADPDFIRMPSVYGGALIFGFGAAGCLGLLAVVRAWVNPLLAGAADAFGGITLELAYPAWPLVLAFVALSLLCGGAIGNLSAPRIAGLAVRSDAS